MLSQDDIIDLQIFCADIRKASLGAIAGVGAGHVGGAMSMVELLAVLYGKVATFDPTDPRCPDRDRIVLSKGHAGPSLYAALALKGFFGMEHLATMNQPNTILPSHADTNKTPGVDFSTGPLGQGLSMAAGSALGARMRGEAYQTFAILGDGECDEGQIWECVLFCSQHGIGNLVVFVDYNKQQLAGWVDDVCRLGDLAAKFAQFGWHAQDIDGHDIPAIHGAIEAARAQPDKPSVVVLNTVKGKGCLKAEKLGLCHHIALSEAEFRVERDRLDAVAADLRRRKGH